MMWRLESFEDCEVAGPTGKVQYPALTVGRGGTVLWMNPAARALVGLDLRGAVGRPVADAFGDWPGLVEVLDSPRPGSREVEVELGRDVRHLEVTLAPLRDARDHTLGRVATLRDVTERRRISDELEAHRQHLRELVDERTAELIASNEQLRQQDVERERLEARARQSRKLEALGELAAGVAHDFNNLLVPILGYTEIARDRTRTGAPVDVELAHVQEAADRAAELAQRILAFGRGQVLRPTVVDLPVLVQSMDGLFSGVLPPDISLDVAITPGVHPVLVDRGQIEQVVMNLVQNARDAIVGAGRVTIHLDNLDLTPRGSEEHELPPGPYARIRVEDTGQGMPDEIRERVFEPFFTTKDRHRGTGLGLAMALGTIRQHGGTISVSSAPGEGTMVEILLPRTDEACDRTSTAGAPAAAVGGSESVLVVDDDEMVRDLVRQALEGKAYRVVTAGGVDAALEVARRGQVDLLLTDVLLPDGTGPALRDKVVDLHPGARTIFMSGYTDADVAGHGIDGGPFLQKPFALARLLAEVGRTLGHPSR